MSAPVQFVAMTVEELEDLAEAAASRALAKVAASRSADDAWLNSAGAAKLLSVSTRTVARLAATKQVPCSRVGMRQLRFRRADLLAYLERA